MLSSVRPQINMEDFNIFGLYVACDASRDVCDPGVSAYILSTNNYISTCGITN